MKKWVVSRPNPEKVRKISNETDLGPLLSEVMAARGYDDLDGLAEFYNLPELSDPFLLSDMQLAVKAINDAIESGELIYIFGDYDCDGITATAVLYGYLESMGANVGYMLPEREDGYGLSVKAIEEMHSLGVSLIVTVDNGVSAVDEAERVKDLGMKLVVTDHHQPTETLPDAVAVVDPHRLGDISPFKNLCGAGVVLKLCAALDGGSYDMVVEQYCDIVAIGTIADVVPLEGENRTIVSRGLSLLKNTENIGLLSLMEQAGVDLGNITASTVAFIIAPRINASSRFGSALTALEMLLSEDESAAKKASELMMLNSHRKTAENEIMNTVCEMIDSEPSLLAGRVLVVSGEGWHRGVIGIVASRLMEIFEKPSVVISVGSDGIACGSARSISGFNIFKCFDDCRDLMIKYGGHELAGGLTVRAEDIPELRKRIEGYALKTSPTMPRYTITADKLLTGRDITPHNAMSLQRLEPCGCGNPEPVFAISGAKILAVQPLKNGEHTKLELGFDGVRVPLLLFRVKTDSFILSVGDMIDVMANMKVNEYKGNISATLRAVDWRPHGIKQERYFVASDAYEKFLRSENLEKPYLAKGLPTRNDLVIIYKYISKRKQGIGFEELYARLLPADINAFKLRIALDAFSESGLIEYSHSTGTIIPKVPTERVDLDAAPVISKLRSLI